MTRDEYVVKRLREDEQMYRVTVRILQATGPILAIMILLALVVRGQFKIGAPLIAFSIYAMLPTYIRTRNAYTAALADIDAHGGVISDKLSDETRNTLNSVYTSSKDMLGALIAYGIIGLMCAGFVVLFIVLIATDSIGTNPDPLYFAGVVLAIIAVIMFLLFLQKIPAYRAAKSFEKQGR